MKNVLSAAAIAGLLLTASCSNRADEQARSAAAQQQRTIDSLNVALTRQHIIDSMNTVATLQAEEQAKADAALQQPVVVATAPARRSSSSSSRSSRSSYSGYSRNDGGSYTAPQPVAQAPVVAEQEKKKGWSGKAKGTAIGAASGAIIGGVVHKNVKGAAVGGVIGAVTGLGVGAVIDKKKGR